ncbi:hypothetical protein ACM26V_16955 [Salipaludibacillus sp. HK11]|uniref:hypothetical protein n=1 Tax=Salipaludibacillus sp. HK11 TaxID=3394320 RepID=UPI0039FC5E8F
MTTENICEYLRKEAVNQLFAMNSFNNSWPSWESVISERINHLSATNVVDLGDNLADIFKLTGVAGRTQSDVSGAGNAWEALVCWYLNLCLIGSRTVVVKQKKSLIPEPIRQSLTVSYGSFPSGTESDLIAITFPNKPDYLEDKHGITIRDNEGSLIPTSVGRNSKFNYKPLVDALFERDFSDCEIGVIQCKTNWNDNAQIPMLWDMIYASRGFRRHSISVGTSTFSIDDLDKFTYSFVTVPTVDRSGINSNSTCVKRVQNLSGGNYWGHASIPSVANSLKDIFGRNFSSASSESLIRRLNSELEKLSGDYSYFNLNNDN